VLPLIYPSTAITVGQQATKLLDDKAQRARESQLQRYLLPLVAKLGQLVVLLMSAGLAFWFVLRRLFQSLGLGSRVVVGKI
jgi:hypothetical protein